LLLQVEVDCGQIVIVDRFGKHGAVALAAERALDGVRGEQGGKTGSGSLPRFGNGKTGSGSLPRFGKNVVRFTYP
jgi:hypothetical protein